MVPRRTTSANLDDESRPFPIDPAGPRVVLVPGVGIVTNGADARRARIARDLYHRAIAVEDAADAIGGFQSLSEPEAFAIEYWPLERYKLAQAPPRGELAGRDRADHRRRERDRQGDRARARRARSARRRRRPQRRRRRGGRRRARRDARRAPRARRRVSTSPTRPRSRTWCARRCSSTAASTSSSPRPASRRARRSPRRRSPNGSSTTPCWRAATSSPRARRSACLEQQGRGGSIVFVASKNALVAGRERRRVLVGQGCVAPPRALPRRGGRSARDPRQHGQPGRRPRRLEHLVVRLEGRAGEHVRRRSRTTCRSSTEAGPSSE